MDCSSDHLIKELNEKWVHIEILDFWCFGKSEHSVKLRDLSWFKTGYWRYYICDVSCWVCSYYEHWRNTHPIMTSSIQNTTNASVFSMLDFIKQASEKLSIYKLIWMKNSDIAIWEQQNSHPNQNLSETRGNISTFMSTSPLIGSDRSVFCRQLCGFGASAHRKKGEFLWNGVELMHETPMPSLTQRDLSS